MGLGAEGSNKITDTLITPFGDFNIPTTFDAAAFGSTSLPAAAAEILTPLGAAALDADWTTLVTDFSALF